MSIQLPRMFSRRTVVSSSILLVENVVRLGLVALVSFWIARQLGPAQFGVLNHVSAVVMVFWSVALLGLDTPVIARLTRSAEPGVIMGSALTLRVLAGVVCALAVSAAMAAMRLGDDGLSMVLTGIVALSIPLSAPLIVDCWFKARNEAMPPAMARIVASFLSSAAKAACLLAGLGVVALAWTIALDTLLTAVALTWVYWRATRRETGLWLTTRKQEAVSLLRESWPYVLSTAAVAAYMKVDIILLGILSTNIETGIYSLCQKISEVLYILPVVVVDVLYPQLVKHHDADGSAKVAATQAFFDLTMAVSMVGTVVAIGLVLWLVPVLFGEPYRPTAHIFVLHAWTCVGVAMAHARFKWMAAAGLQNFAPAVTLLGLVFAVFLNLALIPSHGAYGAAVATVAAYLSSGYLASFMFRALRPAALMQTRALWPWGRLYGELRHRRGR